MGKTENHAVSDIFIQANSIALMWDLSIPSVQYIAMHPVRASERVQYMASRYICDIQQVLIVNLDNPNDTRPDSNVFI